MLAVQSRLLRFCAGCCLAIFSAVKLLDGARWARNAILFWQFMQIAVATATFDSMSGRIPVNIPVGIAAMAPALAIVILLFTKKVMKLTAAQDENKND